VSDVRTGTVTTEAPARLDRLPLVNINPLHRCAMLFPALAGTPRPREG
jgi:hypothetical protein